MTGKVHYNWKEIYLQVRTLLEAGATPQWVSLARQLNLDANSLRRGMTAIFGYTPDLKNFPPAPKDNVSVTDDGNERTFTSISVTGQIRTLPDLIEKCQINMDERIELGHEVKKWDIVLKIRGEDGTDTAQVVPVFYVSLRTVPKNPSPVEPVLVPVEMRIEPGRARKAGKAGIGQSSGKVQRALIIADPQVGFRRRLYGAGFTPFHDRRVLDIALQVAQAEHFDYVSVIGDGLDLSEWSLKYTPEPTFWHTTQPALLELAWWLGALREACPNAEMDLFEGNHEVRPETAVISHMRAAYKLKAVDELHLPPALSIPRLLSLHTLNINYVDGYPNNRKWLNDRVAVSHGDVVRSAPGSTAAAVINKSTFTSAFGHIHRRELVSRKIQTQDGHAIQTAFCPGCACHIDGRVPGSKADDQWQQGFGVIEYAEMTDPHIIPVAVDNGRALYAGREWLARERNAEIDGMLEKKLEEIMRVEGVK